MDISKSDLSNLIDHTNLSPVATEQDLKQLAEEAKQYGFSAVCVYSDDVPIIRKHLNDTGIDIAAVVGFPHGKSPSEIKAEEARAALQNGASEIDMVINQGKLKDGDYEYVREDIETVAEAVHDLSDDYILKVICENCNLPSENLKRQAYRAAHEAGADFIKTSTGFGEYGARLDDVRLMRQTLDDLDSDMGIKAAGGIHYATRSAAENDGVDEDGALEFIQASGGYIDPERFRIGASSGPKIVDSL